MNADRKGELEQDLSRIIGFINNCDSKTSVILAATLTVLTLGLSFFKDEFRNLSEPILTYALLVMLVAVSGAGVYFLLSSLVARLDCDGDSTIYFRSINGFGMEGYLERVGARTEEEYVLDLERQIFANARICTEKYRCYNRGIRLCGIGWLVMLLLLVTLFL